MKTADERVHFFDEQWVKVKLKLRKLFNKDDFYFSEYTPNHIVIANNENFDNETMYPMGDINYDVGCDGKITVEVFASMEDKVGTKLVILPDVSSIRPIMRMVRKVFKGVK